MSAPYVRTDAELDREVALPPSMFGIGSGSDRAHGEAAASAQAISALVFLRSIS
jgi:hypothetical protein